MSANFSGELLHCLASGGWVFETSMKFILVGRTALFNGVFFCGDWQTPKLKFTIFDVLERFLVYIRFKTKSFL